MQVRPDRSAIEQLDSSWVDIGRRSALTYSLRRRWLFRCVESIEFLGATAVRREISVDVEIPKYLPSLEDRGEQDTQLVPISVFAKWPALMKFDLRGPDEHPASLYVRDT